MVSLHQLISVAPFPPDTKNELFSQEETLSSDKKLELEELCWTLISQLYLNELRSKQELAVLEMAKGEKQYTKEDFKKMGDELFADLMKKLEVHGNEEDLAQAREKLGELLQEQPNN
jgi:hypothetical protein